MTAEAPEAAPEAEEATAGAEADEAEAAADGEGERRRRRPHPKRTQLSRAPSARVRAVAERQRHNNPARQKAMDALGAASGPGNEVSSHISIDLSHRPGDIITIDYEAVDIQAAATSERLIISGRSDDEPPTIGPIPPVELGECAGGDAQVLPLPTELAEDTCGEVTLEGRVVSLNGADLAVPIDVDPSAGAVFSEPGTYAVEWVATDSEGIVSEPAIQQVVVGACVAAGASMVIANGATLKDADGSPMALMILQNGFTRVGGEARTGSITSAAPVYVEGGATVAGDVISTSSVDVQARAVIEGQVFEYQAIDLPSPPNVSGSFPSECGESVYYNADTGTHELEPGCYSELRLGSRTTLVLEPGLYQFRNLSVEPQAVLVAPTEGVGFDVRDQMTFRGSIQTPEGEEGVVAVQYRGSQQIVIEAPFSGAVIAPEGTLIMGAPPARYSGEGSMPRTSRYVLAWMLWQSPRSKQISSSFRMVPRRTHR